VDGRVPGARGLSTRGRLLGCTLALLGDRSYRDLAVIDIARAAGSSPATFYQYFPDVESAVLVLAEHMADEHGRLAAIVRGADWRGAGACPAAEALAAEFLAFWIDHQPILRVVDLASGEGDPRFRAIRTRLLNDVTNALAEAVDSMRGQPRGQRPSQPRGQRPSQPRGPGTGQPGGQLPGQPGGQRDADPMAVAAVLVSMLSHVAAHQHGMAAWGIPVDDLRAVMARIVYQTVTGQEPPAP
jgi:AcrR family transcriptional regulator